MVTIIGSPSITTGLIFVILVPEQTVDLKVYIFTVHHLILMLPHVNMKSPNDASSS